MLKPVTVISASSPRVAVEAPPALEPPAPTAGDRARVVWLVGAAVVLAVVGLVLFLTAGGDDPGSSAPPTPSASTPDSIDPGAPTDPPLVTGRRTSAGVVFALGGAGRRPARRHVGVAAHGHRRGRAHHRPSVTVKVPGRVCVQARLIRSGFVSPWGNKCVG